MAVYNLSEGARLVDVPFLREALDSHFLDREDELAAIRSCVLAEDVRLLTLTGHGGVGKTRLAIEVGREVHCHFAHGVVFVDLNSICDPDSVLAAVAQNLGLGDLGNDKLLQRLQAYLAQYELLLILDNVEQVLSAAPVLAELLATAPRLTLLITSREPLHLRCEQVFSVPPLPLPDLQQLPSLPTLSQIGAVALFVQRAQAIDPHFALTEGNARAVAELVVHLDGLPLAIELAAARTALLSPQMILERLGQRLSLLRWHAQDLPERQQTLRSSLAWSYALLLPQEQVLFRHLGVFAGSFSLRAAEAIAEPLVIDPLESLASLVDKSMVQVYGRDQDNVRYVLLESMREYAREKLAEAGEMEDAGHTHALYYVSLAERAEPELTGPEQHLWFARLEWAQENMRAALRWLLERSEGELALRLTTALASFWEARGDVAEGREQLEEALASASAADLLLRAKGLSCLGSLLVQDAIEAEDMHRSIAIEHARVVLGEAVALTRSLEDPLLLTRSLTSLAILGLTAKEWDQARRLLEEARAFWQEMPYPWGTAHTLLHLGAFELIQGNYQEAARLAEESLAHFYILGDDWKRAVARLVVMTATAAGGKGERTAALLQELRGLSDQAQDAGLMALCATGVAWLLRDQVHPERLACVVGAADAIHHATDCAGGVVFCLYAAATRETLRTRIGHEACKAALATGRSLSIEQLAALLERLLEETFQLAPPIGCAPKPEQPAILSPREQDVLQLVAQGLSNKQIAREIMVAETTVKSHVTSVFNKLGVDNRARAVAVAAARSLVVLQD